MHILKDYIQQEIFKGQNYNFIMLGKKVLLNPSCEAIFLMRCFLVWSNLNKHKFLRRLFYHKLISKYGIFVSPNSIIEIGIKLPHPNGIIIGDGVKIGKNNTVYQQVTFGGKNTGDAQNNNYPIIGNNCTFFAGAKVLGKINVAEGTTVGANSVLLSNTESNSVYVGSPAINKSKRGISCQELGTRFEI